MNTNFHGSTSDNIPPPPFSEDELKEQWNAQADEYNHWDNLGLDEQLAWAQARAIAADRDQGAPRDQPLPPVVEAVMDPTNRSPLSPAAQAVLDAANGASSWGPDDCLNDAREIAAAALRAAAHETDAPLSVADIPEQQQRWYGLGVANLKRKLFAIAAELEGRHG